MKKYLDLSTFDNGTKTVLMLILSVAAGLTTMPALATVTADAGQAINWWQMGMTLLGGLAVFLFGMEQMADALKKVAGDRCITSNTPAVVVYRPLVLVRRPGK